MRRHSRSLAVLTLIALACVGVEFSSAVAAPPSAAVLTAATGTAAATTSRAPSSSTSTTTTSECAPVAPTVTDTTITPTSLGFYYSSPSGYQCGVLRTTTLALYADAAHTALVSSFVLPAGTQKGARAFVGLTPSTAYHLVLTLDSPGLSTALPATRTATAPTTYVSPTRTTMPCETGGTADVVPVASTTTTLTYTYQQGGANNCSIASGSLRVDLYTDAAFTQPVKSWSTPAGGTHGATLVSGLAPDTLYYARGWTSGTLSWPLTIAPFRTAATSTPTSTTTTVTDCAPVAPTVTSTQITATNLNFYYSSPSGYQCGVLRSTTLALYADAAHTSLVKSVVLPAGTTTGGVAFSGLTPSTDYYLVLSIDVPSVPATSWPATRTYAGSTGTVTTTTTTTTSTYICDYGGPAQIAPVVSTATSITYTYAYGANACGKIGNGTLRVFLYTDAAFTQFVKEWVPPSGADKGAVVVSGLAPGTTYYGKYQTSGPLGFTGTFASFTTRSVATATTTTITTVCDPFPAQASLDSATSTSLRFGFSSGGATGCDGNGNGVTKVSVYSDAARTVLVGSASSAAGATSGFLTVSGLTPNTTYYPSVRLSNSFFGSPTMPAVSTLPTTTTTCQPIGIAGPSAITSNSITWALPSGLCATTLTATAYRSQADAIAQLNPVTAVTAPLPASSITLGGLVASRDYWVRFSGGFGLQGPLRTAAIVTTTTTVTTPCDPAQPTATFVSATPASVTFTFNAYGGSACGGGVTTITLYRDAAHTSAASSASSVRGATSGTLEVTGLIPGTTYYPVVRLDTSPFGTSAMPSVRTQPFGTSTSTTTTTPPPKTCNATWQPISAWPGGFLAQVTIVNPTTVASSSWRVAWNFSGSARLTASYHATLGGTPTSPILTALDWNRVLQPGGTTIIQVQGTASEAVVAPGIGCTLT